MKKLSRFFTVLALLLSHAMCAVVAYKYRDILCGIAHGGTSAPADMAFLYAIPFAAAIAVSAALAFHFYKKSR